MGKAKYVLKNSSFRWVECQFEALRRCPRSERHLKRCLQALPRSLDETYERMLLNIHEDSYEEARRILTLLCFSSRPLKVLELLHGVAVDLKGPAHLDQESLLEGADDLREICPGLIDFGFEADRHVDSTSPEVTVRIAHFSVQEYLESDRIRQQKAAFFAMSSISAHQEIATICCAYLLEPGLSDGPLVPAKLVEFPLARFAAQFWYHHYQMGTEATAQLRALIVDMFKQQHDSFTTWVKLHDFIHEPRNTRVSFECASDDIAPALYYASLLGLDWVIHEMLLAEKANGCKVENIVNAPGGPYGNALQAASYRGHVETVKILLKNGAEVNAPGRNFGTALQAASHRGRIKTVTILLEKGADVHAQGGFIDVNLQSCAPGTGVWFLQGSEFARWKLEPNSFLWLRGLPGSGKTVLCASIVQNLEDEAKFNPSLLYSFFNFHDEEKQFLEVAIKSLIAQLYSKQKRSRQPITELLVSCKDGHQQPKIESLCTAFEAMLQLVGETWIVLDALDECSDRERSGLLLHLKQWLAIPHTNVHLLVTSRPEPWIQSAPQDWAIDGNILSFPRVNDEEMTASLIGSHTSKTRG
jgi:hypothetical protein